MDKSGGAWKGEAGNLFKSAANLITPFLDCTKHAKQFQIHRHRFSTAAFRNIRHEGEEKTHGGKAPGVTGFLNPSSPQLKSNTGSNLNCRIPKLVPARPKGSARGCRQPPSHPLKTKVKRKKAEKGHPERLNSSSYKGAQKPRRGPI